MTCGVLAHIALRRLLVLLLVVILLYARTLKTMTTGLSKGLMIEIRGDVFDEGPRVGGL